MDAEGIRMQGDAFSGEGVYTFFLQHEAGAFGYFAGVGEACMGVGARQEGAVV